MIELPNKPLLKGSEVSALLPQDPPIEMVDKLWYSKDTISISGLTVLDSNIFSKDGEFQEPGIIENIAQTAALRLGYIVLEKQRNGETSEPPIGFIGAIRKLKIHSLPKVGDDLVTQIEEGNTVFSVTIIHGEVRVNGELIAECEMKIFLKTDDK